MATTFTIPYLTAGTYTWQCPPDVTSVNFYGLGGGGAGGSQAAVSGKSGGGGGGGYANGTITVTPGTLYTLVVGAGGISTGSIAGTGGAGGSTTFGATLAVAGGGGGGVNGIAGALNGAGGAAGTLSGTGITGYNGGAGAVGNATAGQGGGGGGGASNLGAGGTATTGAGGAGSAGYILPSGGNGGTGATTGAGASLTAGSPYGGGGGGSTRSSGASTGGSAGAAGYAYIQFTTQFPTLLQQKSTGSGSGASVAIASTTAGSTVIVFCGSSSNATASSATLNGVTGTRLTGTSSGLWTDVFYWTNVTGGLTSYTVTNTSGISLNAVAEIGNGQQLHVGPATSDFSGTAKTFSSTIVPNLAGQISFAFIATTGVSFSTSPGAPWSTSGTPVGGSAGISLASYQATSNLGNNTAVWTSSAASQYLVLNVNVASTTANFFPFF